ncbi:MAG TPA: DUF3445 domain-containing protein [Stellaceae bacterium]|nr:DUF3445 domain-containing protein [Stellaceae bacterium]
MGLTPLEPEEWLAPDASLRETLGMKRDLLATRRDDVFRALPEAELAATELLDLLVSHLTRCFPAFYRRDGGQIVNLASGEAWRIPAPPHHPLDIAGRLVAEDLCLMQESGSGYRLTAASLCFPNRWQLAAKLGQPLDAIHAPVPGYAPPLASPVAHFFGALKPGRIVARVNWGIADDPVLFQPTGRDAAGTIDPARAGQELWLRVEQQTLRRLPQTGAVLFTIRTAVTRLDEAICSAHDARDLGAAIRDMSPAMLQYKHLAAVAPALLAWLDARAHQHDARGISACAS